MYKVVWSMMSAPRWKCWKITLIGKKCKAASSPLPTTGGMRSKNRSPRPDIVFTDVKMPVMDGIELCKQVHARFPGIQIVFSAATMNLNTRAPHCGTARAATC